MPPTPSAGVPAEDSPSAALSALHRDGRLAAGYPKVQGLLTGLTGPELARAGQLLSRLDPDAVLAEHPGVPTVSAAITGHGTLGTLLPALTAECARHGLLLRARVSAFDSYVFDLSDPGSDLYAADPDLVLCVLDHTVVFDEIPAVWTPDDVRKTVEAKLRLLGGLAERFSGTARGTLVLNTVPLPRPYTAQLVDYRSRAELGVIWREFNAGLLRLSADHPALVVLDLDPLVADGLPVTEPRMSVYAKAHLSVELLAGYAREAGHLARNLTGRTKKVLVLDMDETLWGGILGDDGPDGIEVSGSHRGEAFGAFQRVVRQLGSQGVLVAAVTKNDAELVRQVLTEKPDMTLRESDFVRVNANWRPKHDNLTELAGVLNLGTDSFVFADDSAYECGLVARELPGVTVLKLDAEPALHIDKLLRDGWFDTRQLSAEDRARTGLYRVEAARSDFLQSFSSIDDYLAELGVTVTLAAAADSELARVSQITLRTNQFNLTTQRLQPPQVAALAADPDAQVLVIASADRFGDNGTVGAVLTHRDSDGLHIDNFLLSCRVFSRGIEQACLSALLTHARETGAPAVHGTYRATAKNGNVRDFYPRSGFALVSEDDGTAHYRHDLTDIVPVPAHLRLTREFGTEAGDTTADLTGTGERS
ncbi:MULTISPECIES: HAD-IIIC family phosphatase [unclassified Streptomyces]|uniref:HAD-IIIC family phosphatase n=1 Tax=unclassified Streptomyces TaxID=2593676 RepID=UPI002E2DFD5C|nr:HAD-IIIC family phosphatase [Streptomyces sp. NBC_00223]